MTIRLAAEGAAYLIDDSFTPPRVVGIRQADGAEQYFALQAAQPAAGANAIGARLEAEKLVGAAVALTDNTVADVLSLTLTPGDWDVEGVLATNPGATTTTALIIGWTSATSAVEPTRPNKGGYVFDRGALAAGNQAVWSIGRQRFNVDVTTTIYLSCKINFAISTMAAYGFLGARRVA